MFRRLLVSVLIFLMGGERLGAAPATGTSRPATPDEITLLMEALGKTAADLNRWAYTETRVMRDDKGKVKSESVVRVDPSKPYAEQFTPISVNGKPPTEREIEKHRRKGLAAQKRDEKRERGEIQSNDPRTLSLGEVIEPGKAKIVEEQRGFLVYELPLRKDRNERFPPEKFEVLARIGRESRLVENIAVRLRDSFRMKVIAKVKSGDATLEFAVVDPKYPPTLTAVKGDAQVSILFVNVGGEIDLKRTELKHVKPFNERFDVEIGTLKAIDF